MICLMPLIFILIVTALIFELIIPLYYHYLIFSYETDILGMEHLCYTNKLRREAENEDWVPQCNYRHTAYHIP